MNTVSRPDKRDRFALTLISLLMIGASVYALLRSWGVFGDRRADEMLVTPQMADFINRNELRFWPIVGVIAIITGVIAYKWLRAHFPPVQRFSRLELDHSDEGTTAIKVPGIASTLEDRIESFEGVTSAACIVQDSHPVIDLRVRVGVNDEASLASLRQRIDREAFGDLKTALEGRDVHGEVEFVFVGSGNSRLS